MALIAAAALVWHICLPNRHEEHLITLQRGLSGRFCAKGYFWQIKDYVPDYQAKSYLSTGIGLVFSKQLLYLHCITQRVKALASGSSIQPQCLKLRSSLTKWGFFCPLLSVSIFIQILPKLSNIMGIYAVRCNQ
jgi:hypothetical protein